MSLLSFLLPESFSLTSVTPTRLHQSSYSKSSLKAAFTVHLLCAGHCAKLYVSSSGSQPCGMSNYHFTCEESEAPHPVKWQSQDSHVGLSDWADVNENRTAYFALTKTVPERPSAFGCATLRMLWRKSYSF